MQRFTVIAAATGLTAFNVFAPHRGHAQTDSEIGTSYQEYEVAFGHGDIRFAGTLTLPLSSPPHPAVVLLSGSGAQDRDAELFGFRIFAEIADALSRSGIAVLRYDDRGVGGSSGDGSTATAPDLAKDALAAIAHLQGRPDISPRKIGLLGHSEGGAIAPLAATQSDDVAFMILLAAPALTGKEILYLQGERIIQADGGTEEDLALQRYVQDVIFTAVETNSGWHEASATLEGQLRSQIDRLPAEERTAIPDEDAYVFSHLTIQMNRITSPWFRYFLSYDPRDALRQVGVPVLALFGQLDTQVPHAENIAAMRHAFLEAGHSRFSIETLLGANHLFAPANSGSPREYPLMEKRFVPGFLERITDWILSEAW